MHRLLAPWIVTQVFETTKVRIRRDRTVDPISRPQKKVHGILSIVVLNEALNLDISQLLARLGLPPQDTVS
jgi:hypothetical protein